MKTRIFLFHPDINNQSRANQALVNAAKDAGIEVRDEYALYPDFKIDVKAEQAILEDTDRIIFQFPMYWYSSPALFKEWQDRVLEYGWAYGSTGNALQGKEVILALTQGAKAEDYTINGRFQVTTEELLKPFETIRFHTGLNFMEPFVVSGALNLSDSELVKAAQDYVARLTEE